MRSSHSGRSLPLLTATKRNTKPARGVVSWLGGMTIIALVLLIGWQTFPQHIQASLTAEHEYFPNIAAAQLNATRHALQQQGTGGILNTATAGSATRRAAEEMGGVHGSTLVTYLIGNTMGLDGPTISELANFEFFLEHGIQQHPSTSYLLLMHKTWGAFVEESVLAALPSNVRIVWHEATCGGWGLLGWAIETGHLVLEQYAAYVLVTPSMKGPFIPPYYQSTGLHWSHIFTAKLNAQVKLVAPMITCEPAMSLVAAPRHNPHPVPTMAALDAVTLKTLYERGTGLKCYQAPLEALYHGDAGVALQLLHAGFNLDSLMARYQGVDWRITRMWNCNDGVSPMGARSYDGIDMHPYEVIFMPLEQRMLDVRFGAAVVASKYTAWLQHTPERRNISENEFMRYENAYREIQRAMLQQLDRRCFDVTYYRNNNPDLQGYDDDFLWAQWLSHGQFEARRWLFTCNRLAPG